MDDEWTDWFQHDGKGCPCAGQFVEVVYQGSCGEISGAMGVAKDGRSWDWAPDFKRVILYRIRKPRAMAQIRALLENLPERVDP